MNCTCTCIQHRPHESTEVGELYTALGKFMATTVGQFELDSDGQRAKFGSLAGILKTAIPELTKNDLAFNFREMSTEDGRRILNCKIVHGPSNQWIESNSWLIPDEGKPNPHQEFGSTLTYWRRYSAMNMLNIRPSDQEDDDGASKERKHESSAPAPKKEYTASPNKPISDAQLYKLTRLMDDADIDYDIEELKKLTSAAASDAIKRLNK